MIGFPKPTRKKKLTPLDKAIAKAAEKRGIELAKTDRYGRNRREKSIWIDGYRFDSPSEGQLYLGLKARKQAGEFVYLKCQDVLYLTGARFMMKPDFRVTMPDGEYEWHEMKGVETDVWKRNTRLWKAGYGPHPGAKLTVWKLNRRGLYVWKVIVDPRQPIKQEEDKK